MSQVFAYTANLQNPKNTIGIYYAMKYKSGKYRIIIIIFSLILLCFISRWWYFFSLTPYIPVVLTIKRGDHSLEYDRSLLTPEHIDRFCKTLDQYNEKYLRKGDVVYIPRWLHRDMDLLQNYTNKSLENPAFGPINRIPL